MRTASAPARPLPPGAGSRALPLIDEHTLEIGADRERVWRALVEAMSRSKPGAGRFAALLGCRERTASGEAGEVGSTIVGFRVVRAEAPRELALGGEHRFSRYTLTFTIDALGEGRSRLHATTHAAFPGVHGRAYRAGDRQRCARARGARHARDDRRADGRIHVAFLTLACAILSWRRLKSL